MRIHIDQNVCIECGLCASTCPDVFEQNEGQKASIVNGYQLGAAIDGEVGEPLQRCTEEAAASCPVEAIDTIANPVEIKKKKGIVKDAEQKLIMENNRDGVLYVWFKPGEKAPMHTHSDHVVYVFNDGKLKLTLSKGKIQELNLKAGQAFWFDAISHTVENLGKTDVHLLVFELKE